MTTQNEVQRILEQYKAIHAAAAVVVVELLQPAQRSPLPINMWGNNLSQGDAIALQRSLSPSYQTSRGKDSGGYFVRCPYWQTVLDPQWIPANADWAVVA